MPAMRPRSQAPRLLLAAFGAGLILTAAFVDEASAQGRGRRARGAGAVDAARAINGMARPMDATPAWWGPGYAYGTPPVWGYGGYGYGYNNGWAYPGYGWNGGGGAWGWSPTWGWNNGWNGGWAGGGWVGRPGAAPVPPRFTPSAYAPMWNGDAFGVNRGFSVQGGTWYPGWGVVSSGAVPPHSNR
jgi:hypothetical protein